MSDEIIEPEQNEQKPEQKAEQKPAKALPPKNAGFAQKLNNLSRFNKKNNSMVSPKTGGRGIKGSGFKGGGMKKGK